MEDNTRNHGPHGPHGALGPKTDNSFPNSKKNVVWAPWAPWDLGPYQWYFSCHHFGFAFFPFFIDFQFAFYLFLI